MVNDLSPRDALFGYRLRFAPETQPIRQTVFDSIVLRNIQDFKGELGATVGKLHNLTIHAGQEIAISIDDAKASLARLEQAKLIESKTVKRKQHWFLTDRGRTDIAARVAHTGRMRSRALDVLLGEHDNKAEFADPFFDTLGLIFDEITVGYLEAMFSERPSPITPSIVDAAVQRVTKARAVDAEILKSAVERFFREDTPEFTWLKWTYCKNYYAVRAVGLGAGADVLSAKLFSQATFFLDTNVIICALDPSSERHLSAQQVLRGLARIGCEVKVLQITLQELRELAEALKDNLSEVLRQIPDGLLPKVNGFVARAEARHRRDEGEPAPEELLEQISRAEELVVSRLNVSVIADDWFDQQYDSEEIVTLSESLRQHYDNSVVHRRKTSAAALHDALALTYMAHLCRRRTEGAYFVTLDRSLPHYKPASLFDGLRVNRAMTLWALMPWLSAVAGDDEEAAAALSRALSADLLPHPRGYSIQEFRMLAELGMDCGQMPLEDVEQCLLFLRHQARSVNPATADGREKLHALVRGFFSSPDRKYLTELSALQNELTTARDEASAERATRRDTEKREQQLRKELRDRRLGTRVVIRLGIAFLTWLVLMPLAVLVAHLYGSGANIMQKFGSMVWLPTLITALCLIMARFLCRGELWNYAKSYFATLGR